MKARALVIPVCLLLIGALWVYSTASRVTWNFTMRPGVGVNAGDTLIEMEHVTLVFTDVDLNKAVGGVIGVSGGTMVVDGTGSHTVTLSVAGHEFTNSYVDGKNTLTFEDHTLVLAKTGTELRYAGNVYEIKDAAIRLVIAPDGTLEQVEQTPLAASTPAS